ncbi:S-adenosylmethionine synthetase N-terminal domain-containing protein [Alloscardovia omnicolens]|uniref:S-adenosylmethionine synthetase N-terminal domain-containing protein n=1 Tax=Alloscardovia omnicolens TaxID=419015 RepID=UPI003A72F206
MFEKVNPMHPDKIADRIAGAIVDAAYEREVNPKIAVEVLIGHGECTVIIESSCNIASEAIVKIVQRIAGNVYVHISICPQDTHLAQNQEGVFRAGDNGIFCGMPLSDEEQELSEIARDIFDAYPTDGKYILDGERLIICQSGADTAELSSIFPEADVNPLGNWSGGTNVDTGATNRKLGSDMGRAITGGGLHGKDLSKADVSVNIYAHLKAQALQRPVHIACAIGDETVDGRPFSEIVEIAREYIEAIGGFEAFAEWGLI